jgi:BolA family transcriptional regulator, general stress-responsive regulator
MSELPAMADRLRAKLAAALRPSSLSIADESARHAGHAGAREGGETHFRIRIVSAEFAGLSRVERQRRVYAAVAEEISDGVHALALMTLTPDEAGDSS